ncbi:hypothetical protein L1987_06550 [Smallanthus sonchifolius]|uniref:Uncharacterized protein n=1 Tax=Smallanthus sonchifolius TaxID=185202 RepID=A0ACB9JYE6_9ASTR|nr:hypothetical protein L1987_06550 [Smallanthus sonchifolius]
MSDLSMSCLVDDKKLVRKIMGIKSNEGCYRVTRCVHVKTMKLDEKNIARVLPGRITEVKFFPARDTRMPVVGNNCGNVCFFNIDSDEDNGIYVHHPHSDLVSRISIHPYSLSNSPREPGPISMRDLSMSCLVDDKKLVRKIMGIKSNEGCCRVIRCVDVKAMKLDETNIARVLPQRITEVMFFHAGDTRMLVVGNNCGNVGFWNIDFDEDNGTYFYHPNLGLVSGISFHLYSLS